MKRQIVIDMMGNDVFHCWVGHRELLGLEIVVRQFDIPLKDPLGSPEDTYVESRQHTSLDETLKDKEE